MNKAAGERRGEVVGMIDAILHSWLNLGTDRLQR
jgi:hypothetical protein